MARRFTIAFDEEWPEDKVLVAVAPIDAFTGRIVQQNVDASIEGLPDRPIRNLSGLLVFLKPKPSAEGDEADATVTRPNQEKYRIRVTAEAAGYFDPDPVEFERPGSDEDSASATGYDLRLMSVDATDELIGQGSSLVVAALVGTKLHIRIFDVRGVRVVDKAESELADGETLTALKQRLSPLPDGSSLSRQEKQEIIENATLIAGHTLAPRLRIDVPLLRLPSFASPEEAALVSGVVVRGGQPVAGARIWAELPASSVPRNGDPPRAFEAKSDPRGAFALALRLPAWEDNPGSLVTVGLHVEEGADHRRLERKVKEHRRHVFKKPIDVTSSESPELLIQMRGTWK
jgi:hypothetical protein